MKMATRTCEPAFNSADVDSLRARDDRSGKQLYFSAARRTIHYCDPKRVRDRCVRSIAQAGGVCSSELLCDSIVKASSGLTKFLGPREREHSDEALCGPRIYFLGVHPMAPQDCCERDDSTSSKWIGHE
jgi:hypothetical protein